MNNSNKNLCIFLCGDVMLGRGIDQILPHPNKPQLYESYITDARDYVDLAEKVNGKISYPVSMDYIWGDALEVWQKFQPTLKIINLETAITQSEESWPNKGINYRMHPLNVDVLKIAGIDICTLANNHILDWRYAGLKETMATLKNAGIKFSGVGENIKEAMQPAIFELDNNKRALVFSAGTATSGVPSEWSATDKLPGLYYFSETKQNLLQAIEENIKQYRQSGDLIIFSIHWGSNWGYTIADDFRKFAHALIDQVKVDVVFCHSSHHPRPIEIYHDKPIFYGCGDFINDYEGISGYEQYRDDLTLMYFLEFDKFSLQFKKLKLVPLQIKNFRLHSANNEDCQWLLQTLNQSAAFCSQFILRDHNLVYFENS